MTRRQKVGWCLFAISVIGTAVALIIVYYRTWPRPTPDWEWAADAAVRVTAVVGIVVALTCTLIFVVGRLLRRLGWESPVRDHLRKHWKFWVILAVIAAALAVLYWAPPDWLSRAPDRTYRRSWGR